MTIAIRFYTKSKKGNTKKLADAISKTLDVVALDTSNPLEEKVDVLFFANAMYAADVDKNIKEFLKLNKDKIGMLVNLNTSASGKSTLKAIKKVADPLNINVSEKEFHCAGSWIFINKGKPTDEDLKNAQEFVKTFLS